MKPIFLQVFVCLFVILFCFHREEPAGEQCKAEPQRLILNCSEGEFKSTFSFKWKKKFSRLFIVSKINFYL